MNKIIALVGRAAVGKTTLEKLLERDFGYVPLISHTTRPQRDGEIDGQEYHFSTNEEVEKMIADKQTLENVDYLVNGETWHYVLSRKEVESKIKDNKRIVVTINPHGLEQLLDHADIAAKLIVVYMVADDNLQFRYYARETESLETAKKWKQRKIQDDIDFERFENEIVPRIVKNHIPLIKFDNTLNDEEKMYDTDVADFSRTIEQYITDEQCFYIIQHQKYFNY